MKHCSSGSSVRRAAAFVARCAAAFPALTLQLQDLPQAAVLQAVEQGEALRRVGAHGVLRRQIADEVLDALADLVREVRRGRADQLVDVAGGHGEILMTILKANPAMKGIVCDIAHVVEGAKPRIASAGLADRMQALPCDFFESVPAGGDAYVMKHIIHDWYDDKASLILKTIAKAMGATKGKVILLESVVAAGSTPDFGKFLDIEMLLFPGGRERTEAEFRSLFDGAGFTSFDGALFASFEAAGLAAAGSFFFFLKKLNMAAS